MNVQLYNADCLDVLRGMADNSVDTIITDPPYSEITHEGARSHNDIDNPMITFESITSEQLREILHECGRVMRRWLIATMDWRHIYELEKNVPESLRFVRFGVWIKPNGAPQFTGDRPATGWEGVGIFHKIGGKMRWNGGGHHAVWIENRVNGPHPTCKPEPLVRKWVDLFSDPGDTILDPFMGSGTTGVCAVAAKRNFVGMEIDKKYFDVAERRIRLEGIRPKQIDLLMAE